MGQPVDAPDWVLVAEQACEATSLWLLRQYEAALQTLQKLEVSMPGQDPKLQLNAAVAEHYASGGRDVDKLMQQLTALEGQSTSDAASTQSSHAEAPAASSTAGTTDTSASERVVAAINRGLLLFLRQQHKSALALLEPLYEQVESIHEGAALRLCLLLLDIYLASRQHSKAAGIIAYLEVSSGLVPGQSSREGGGGMGGSMGSSGLLGSDQGDEGPAGEADRAGTPELGFARSRTPPLQARAGAWPQQQQGAEASRRGDAAADGEGSEGPALALPSVSRVASPLMERVGELVASQQQQQGQQQQAGSRLAMPDVRALLGLYKARLHLSCGNHKAAKREVKGLLAALPGCAQGLGLKAELEAARGHPRKALRTLGPLLHDKEELGRYKLQLLNNLGILHHLFGKHQTAALYLSRALQLAATLAPGAPQAAAVDSSNASTASSATAGGSREAAFAGLAAEQRHAVLYNVGLQHLMLKNYEVARNCFQEAAGRYYSQPLLWVRMAEATIGCYQQEQRRQQQHAQQAAAAAGYPAGVEVIGSGMQQRLLLPEGHAPRAVANGSSGEGHALLEQALQQLSTALALLQDLKAVAAKEAEEAAAVAAAAAAAVAAEEAASSAEAGSSGQASVNSNGQQHGPQISSSTAASAAAAAAAAAARRLSDAPSEQELEATQQAALACAAFVHLLREDPVPALGAARQLLACSNLSQEHQFLGSCYAAEALCMLGSPEEAGEQLRSHLARYMSGADRTIGSYASAPPTPSSAAPRSVRSDDDVSSRESYSLGNAADAAKLTGQAALAATHSNLAAIAAMQGDLAQCCEGARTALAAEPDKRSALLLLVYAELARGNTAAALAVLKEAGQAQAQ